MIVTCNATFKSRFPALSTNGVLPMLVRICPPYAARSTRQTLLPPNPNELEAVTRTR